MPLSVFGVRFSTEFKHLVFPKHILPYSHEHVAVLVYHQKGKKSLMSQFT